MNIKRIVNSNCEENCYLIYEGNNGVLIDPGSDGDKILKECEEIDVQYILLTHCHYDHIEALDKIRNEKKSVVISSENCVKNMTDSVINASLFFGNSVSFKPADKVISDNEIIKTSVGDIKCIYTPGHTDCSACFLINEHLFSGDTLFKLSIGRCDLKTGNMSEIEKSIREKLYTLDEDIIVHPGHGSDTTIGYEKKHNLYFKVEK